MIVTAQDLLDRCLHIDLPTIHGHPEAGRRHGSPVRGGIARAAGRAVDPFVEVLALLPSVAIAPEHRPRMADFAALGEAVFRVHGKAGPVLSWPGTTTCGRMACYAPSIRHLSARRWPSLRRTGRRLHGTLSELLDRLDRYRRGEAWPRSPKGLGDTLRRLAPRCA